MGSDAHAGRFVATERTEGVSTSDLKVGFINENRYRIQNRVERVKEKGKKLVDQVADQSAELIHKWEANSREFIGTFLQLFGPDGFKELLDGTKQRMLRAISPVNSDIESEDEEDYLSGEESAQPVGESGDGAEEKGALPKQRKMETEENVYSKDFSDSDG